MGTSEWYITIEDVPVVERELRLMLNEMVLVLVIVIGARVVGRMNAITITITITSTRTATKTITITSTAQG